MVERKCSNCEKIYKVASREGLFEFFNYKNRERTAFASYCRTCKSLMDTRRNRNNDKKAWDYFKEKTRHETKKLYKGNYFCSVLSCEGKAELHHIDYKDPKAVIPLCRIHHSSIHALMKLCEKVTKPQGAP